MKKMLFLLPLVALPFVAHASDVRVNVGIGGPAVVAPGAYKYGDRDKRGYYWDGNTWRDQAYWDKNQGKGKGGQGCPPGQAKKGNC